LVTRIGICLNREKCPLARREEVITVDLGDSFDCPVCNSALKQVQLQKEVQPPSIEVQLQKELQRQKEEERQREEERLKKAQLQASSRRRAVAISLLVLVLIAAAASSFIFKDKLLHGFGGHSAAHGKVLLRLAGSNTIGDKLVPALAEAYLRSQGATDIYTKVGATAEVKTVFGVLPGGSDSAEIDIAARGSATAFTSLADGSCDIGMASRSVKPDEITKLTALGTMTDPTNEHVLGLDGIAIIVNPHNPLNEISEDKLRSIFTGEVHNWENNGAIDIYARDDKSGTYDTFKNLVLNGKPMSKSAKRFEDSNVLSDAVANDPNGIGFIGLPFIHNAKALAISDNGTKPLLPTMLTVATEDYVLSRRLYLYTPATPANPRVREFVQFALSPAGQQLVAANGFVAQTAEQVTQKVAADAPPEYRALTANAQRMPINFRFLFGKSQLDNRALADLDRVVARLATSEGSKVRILLFGFADSLGGQDVNQMLSSARAHVVADELSRRGITASVVEGFGAAMPVASNDSLEGREKNRRVEIWIGGQGALAGAE
jgi:phosphate transport system substrate-binding protein